MLSILSYSIFSLRYIELSITELKTLNLVWNTSKIFSYTTTNKF